ncbi:hypothetical protein NL448_28690, partial [Klebsiella pneumoniae]|nr:hypothetical protein [Klebsiella pneumoniae]
FDKPGGRIAAVIAASKNLTPAQISAYYNEALPQLGWQKNGENQYVREGERLKLDVMRKPPLTVVRFNLSPAAP